MAVIRFRMKAVNKKYDLNPRRTVISLPSHQDFSGRNS